MLNALGSKVTVVLRSTEVRFGWLLHSMHVAGAHSLTFPPKVLTHFDKMLREEVEREMAAAGIAFIKHTYVCFGFQLVLKVENRLTPLAICKQVSSLAKAADGTITVSLEDRETKEAKPPLLGQSCVLMATGRAPNSNIGLDKAVRCCIFDMIDTRHVDFTAEWHVPVPSFSCRA